jgi:cutinase
MAFTVLALIAMLLLPVQTSVDGCSDVHVIGARGSGQQAGYGEQVAPVVEAITLSMAGRGLSVASSSLEYPAISVSDSFGLVLINGRYDASVHAGVTALRATIGRLAGECPTTDVVLVGYSQGAQVIKTALEGSQPGYRISGVVLLADPTRDRSQLGITRLGDPAVERSGSFGAIALPDHLRTVTIDVCAEGDGVCERGRRSFTAHTEGYRDAPQLIAPRLLLELEEHIGSFGLLR